jgi:alpha-glucuronidase
MPAFFVSRFALRIFALVGVLVARSASAEDGYRLWLRYDRIGDETLRAGYAAAAQRIVLAASGDAASATLAAARDELTSGCSGLLGTTPKIEFARAQRVPALGDDGYAIARRDAHTIVVSANRDIGVLYGAFALLRDFQTQRPLEAISDTSVPKIQRRILDHWDGLNRAVERGYAGQSIWEWFVLPDVVSPRYRDYARANASLGINGAVLNNVNADPLILTREFLVKAAAIANALRPYGIRVYLSARFSSPVEIGGLKMADPADPEVVAWWRAKVDEIYQLMPDFGGFVVKANSEGQPGPQDYHRTHAEGANVLADALAPHGGIVMWRAFVYATTKEDRVKQAYNEFKPLDGQFRPNVVVQIKNGPLDFQPREPFHPLFGAMPRTPLALELQITQEYLGQGTQLAFLAPLWKECLDSDTFRPAAGANLARVIDGSLDHHELSVIAGVANIGTDRDWCGHPLAAANWYAFGRLAWDHSLSAAQLADEWTRQTFSNDPRVLQPITSMLVASREAVVDYSMPLGLHHIMATGHHYGPGPWVNTLRADWNPVYYHRADPAGLGFDRTVAGSNALEQYAPEVARRWADLASCPDNLLLWFHHVPWEYRMSSGRTLWDELCQHYQHGIDTVRGWQKTWNSLRPLIDAERFEHVQALLARQERDAREWRDACTQYFATFSKLPLPPGVELPERPLEYYEHKQLHYPPGWSPGK